MSGREVRAVSGFLCFVAKCCKFLGASRTRGPPVAAIYR